MIDCRKLLRALLTAGSIACCLLYPRGSGADLLLDGPVSPKSRAHFQAFDAICASHLDQLSRALQGRRADVSGKTEHGLHAGFKEEARRSLSQVSALWLF